MSSAKYCSIWYVFVIYLSLGEARKTEAFPKDILKWGIPCRIVTLSPFPCHLSWRCFHHLLPCGSYTGYGSWLRASGMWLHGRKYKGQSVSFPHIWRLGEFVWIAYSTFKYKWMTTGHHKTRFIHYSSEVYQTLKKGNIWSPHSFQYRHTYHMTGDTAMGFLKFLFFYFSLGSYFP